MTIGRGELDNILGLRLRRAHGAVQRHFVEHFADLGLTQKQVSVLWLTGDHPDLAQADLAQALDMDRATTMALVHGLEKRGLVSRSPSRTDGRRIAFRLTADGTALLARAKAAILEHETWVKARFSAAELGMLEELLARIYR
ncbi:MULTISPECIES: MarR family winged helix-turn-helix transcriptional regulator [unclassified Sphingomonas]|uniref:MarR family winged helix-turn-helix transcriptional regulator n=1 Tax=unclassified Sphingomonas TaxID=196159 RepID=UPI002150C841|nr:MULTISPECIES: MarR family transcriptional regulator [unclassified Sphingomonas]MCR5872474.1 MarR family transcriptional regulator [Sphingomonas sp. J344]UUX99241.1 MarR family transcriptional regulator [Sphingomonas sp. J315]